MFSTKLLNTHEQQIVTAHNKNRRTSQLVNAPSNVPSQAPATATASKYGVKYKSNRSFSLNTPVNAARSSMKQHDKKTAASGTGAPAQRTPRRFYSFKAPKRLDANGQPLHAGTGGSLKMNNFVNGPGGSKKCVVNGGAVAANVAAGRTSFRIGGPKTNSVSRRVTKMVIVVSLFFLMLNLPLHMFNIYIFTRMSCTGSKTYTKLEDFMFNLMQAMFFTSFSCNFLLYSISGVTFRTEIHRIFVKPFCTKKSTGPTR